MSEQFDSYYQWLGIPPEEQPPHLYRLLGIKPLEENPDVIETAADRQMAHVRTYQSGARADLSQKLLNELSAAKVRLLDPAKKAAYDAELQATLAADRQSHRADEKAESGEKKFRRPRPLAVAQPLPQAEPLPQTEPQLAAVSVAPSPDVYVAPRRSRGRGNSSAAVVVLAIGAAVALLLLAGAAAVGMMLLGGGEQVADRGSAKSTGDGAKHSHGSTSASSSQTDSLPPTPPTAGDTAKDDPSDAADPPKETPAEDQPDDRPTDEPADNRPADPMESPIDNPPANLPDTLIDEPAEPAAPKKLPVPGRAAREAQRAEILQIFPVDKARSVQEKWQLAGHLLKTARETKTDPAAQFALLNLAREQAVESGQIKLAFEAIDLLDGVFQFDADAVRVVSLEEAAKAPLPPAAKGDIVALGMGMIDAFLVGDEFDKALALSERLSGIARATRDAGLIKSFADQRRIIDDLSANYRRAKVAFETLKTSPDDPGANLSAGRYLAFVKQDWEIGLAHLAKGSDPLLSAAAKAELADPQSTDDKVATADRWWGAAEAEKDQTSQDFCRVRSGFWYGKAVGDLAGLTKAKAEQRIYEAEKIELPPKPVTSSNIGKWISVFPAQRQAHKLVIPENTDGFVRIENDILIMDGGRRVSVFCPGIARDVIVKAQMKFAGNRGQATINLRSGNDVGYSFGVGADGWVMTGRTANGWRSLNRTEVTLPSDYFECAVAAIGDHLIVWIDGVKQVHLRDAFVPQPGIISFGAMESVLVQYRKIEVLAPTSLEIRAMIDNSFATPGPADSSRDAAELQPRKAPTDGLVAHWKFDEGQGAVARDSAGGHSGAIKGATWTKGINGSALRFDGTSNYVIVEDQPRLETHRAISLSAWAKPLEMSTGNGLALILQHVTNDVWRTVVLSCVKGSGEYYGGMTISSKSSIARATIPEDDISNWTHLCLTHDGSKVRLFRNGKLFVEERSTIDNFAVHGRWMIGGEDYRGGRRFYHGDIDDVRIYNRALSDEEVAALYTATSGRPAPQADSGEPDLGIFSRDPAELGSPTSDDGLRRLLLEHVWYRPDGRLHFVFDEDGSCVGTSPSDPKFRSVWTGWELNGVKLKIKSNIDVMLIFEPDKRRFVGDRYILEVHKRRDDAGTATPEPLPKTSDSARPAPKGVWPGMIGRAKVNGVDAGVIIQYVPGKKITHSKIAAAAGLQGSAKIEVQLAGVLVLEKPAALKVRHKGGSSSGGVLKLKINGRELGAVGDDRTKDTTYDVNLPAGNHAVVWTLSGGSLGGDNRLEFKDAATSEPAPVLYNQAMLSQQRLLPTRAEADLSE